jgi:hypothetical protein
MKGWLRGVDAATGTRRVPGAPGGVTPELGPTPTLVVHARRPISTAMRMLRGTSSSSRACKRRVHARVSTRLCLNHHRQSWPWWSWPPPSWQSVHYGHLARAASGVTPHRTGAAARGRAGTGSTWSKASRGIPRAGGHRRLGAWPTSASPCPTCPCVRSLWSPLAASRSCERWLACSPAATR